MYLEELYEYPHKLAKKLIASQNIIDLLKDQLNSECPDDTILDGTVDNPPLVNDWDNIDGVCSKAGSYICIDVDVFERTNEVIKGMRLFIYIIVHNSKMKLSSSFGRIGNRRDVLADEIDKILADVWFGKSELKLVKRNPVTRFRPADGYAGRLLIYECEDTVRTGYPK